MRRLFCAGMERLGKNKLFYAEIAFIAIWSGLVLFMQNKERMAGAIYAPAELLLFSGFTYMGIMAAIFCSLFVGTEYSDGTIRNKIIVGHRRRDIYLTNAFLVSFAGIVCTLVSMLISGVGGVLLFGKYTMPFPELLVLILDYFLAGLAYVSLFHLTAMLCDNRSYAAVVNTVGAFVFLFVGIYLYQMLSSPEAIPQMSIRDGEVVTEMVANSHYLRGIKREIYQFFFDLLPGGQMLQIAQGEVLHPRRIALYSICVTAGANVAGMLIFRRKDIR